MYESSDIGPFYVRREAHHSSALTHARVFPSTAAKADISRVSSNLSDRSSDSDEKYSRSGVKSRPSRCRGVVVDRRTS